MIYRRWGWLFVAIVLIAATDAARAQEVKSSVGILTLNAAIDRALAQSPRLKSADAALQASKGSRRQASALPNPELGVAVENIQGRREYRGFKSAEVTYGLSQKIEIGGKRGRRTDVAEQGVILSRFDYEAERLDLIRDVTVAYHEAAAAGERVKLAAEQKKLAEDVYQEVNERVSAAREPLIQRSKVEVTRSISLLAYDKARRDFEQSKRKLAALWGGDSMALSPDRSALFRLQPPQRLSDPGTAIAKNPNVTRWESEVRRGKAAIELEQANALPDPNLNVGVRDFRATGDRAFVVGLSIPIPLFDANRGNIVKARHEAAKAESDQVIARTKLSTELSQRHYELTTAYAQAKSFKVSILPSAQKAFDLSRQGYRAGKFSYLEVLDAQRTLFEAKEQQISALRDYQMAKAEIERLTAKHVRNETAAEDDENE